MEHSHRGMSYRFCCAGDYRSRATAETRRETGRSASRAPRPCSSRASPQHVSQSLSKKEEKMLHATSLPTTEKANGRDCARQPALSHVPERLDLICREVGTVSPAHNRP
jgi:hypothetical protein